MSEATARLAGLGIAPPYREKASGGLVVRGASGAVMFDARPEKLLFERYEDVPSLVVESLLFIEDRELLGTGSPRHNPAFDWERLSRAWLLYVGRGLGLPLADRRRQHARHADREAAPLARRAHVHAAGQAPAGHGREPESLPIGTRYARAPAGHRRRLPELDAARGGAGPWRGARTGRRSASLVWTRFRRRAAQPPGSAASRRKRSPRTRLCSPCSAPCASRRDSWCRIAPRSSERLNAYTRLLGAAGVLSPELAERVAQAPLQFRTSPPGAMARARERTKGGRRRAYGAARPAARAEALRPRSPGCRGRQHDRRAAAGRRPAPADGPARSGFRREPRAHGQAPLVAGKSG